MEFCQMDEPTNRVHNVNVVTRDSLARLCDNAIFRFSTYCKLFVAMGLSWSLELLAWLLRVLADEAPKELIMALNVANIFQVRDLSA